MLAECLLQISFDCEGGDVELFEGFGDAFGLGVGKASRFELLDDAVRVDHKRLHRSLV